MGGATVGSAITTAGLGDWETGNTLNLNGDSQRFRARLDSTCGENWQVPSFSWFAGPTVFEVCSSLCSLMFTVLFCEIHGVPLEFQGHVIAYVIHRVLLRRIFAVLGLLYPHHFCQAWRHVLHCYVSCLTCLLKSWETVHPVGLLAGRKYFVTDCKMISSIHRFLEISRVNFIQVSHIMFQHIATKYVAMLDGTYMTVASVASVACHQDGFNSVCTLPAGCIFDDTSLGDTKPVVLPCCPCHGGAALHCALRNARCQLDLYDLDFVIDVTINPPSSRLSAVLQCSSATVPHTGWDQHSWSMLVPKHPRLLDDRPGLKNCGVRCDMMWPVSSWNLSEPHAVAGSLGRE